MQTARSSSSFTAILVLLIAILVGVSVSAAVPDWNIHADTLRVSDDIHIAYGDTVTIPPGTVVALDPYVSITVRGTLLANGTECDSIRFVSSSESPWGGIHIVDGGSATFSFASITGGSTDRQNRTIGGAILVDGSHSRLELTDSRVSGNVASEAGGGLAIERGGSAIVTRTAFTGNRAGTGGGLVVGPGSADLRSVVFRSNIGDDAGGGATVADGGRASFSDCTFEMNETRQAGGGVVVAQGGHADFIDCRFWRNRSGKVGGAIGVAHGGVVTASHVTIAENRAAYPLGGGALAVSDGSVSIRNSILWRNTRNEVSNNPFSRGQIDISYSIVRGGWNGPGNLDVDPGFADVSAGDLNLITDSPARNPADARTFSESDHAHPDMGARRP
jgi:hypothetical protein